MMKATKDKNNSTYTVLQGKVGASGRIYALDPKEIPVNRNIEQMKVRYQRWVDALPKAISCIAGCEAMRRGDLFSIKRLEAIDGNSIAFILLDVLIKEYIIDDDGDCEYEQDEEFSSEVNLRKRCVYDAELALIHLLDYRRYCDKYHADEFYKRFYKPGTTCVDEMGKRAVLTALSQFH